MTEKICKDCKRAFNPLPNKEWATQCMDCWKKQKAAINPLAQDKPVVVNSTAKSTSSQTMYTAYAKDIFISLIEARKEIVKVEDYYDLMKISIYLVKTAKDSFNNN